MLYGIINRDGTKDNFMIGLQYELERAIEEERYEDAAEIQKKIDEVKALYKFLFDEYS
jgi:protein-arginine kinase activator protein McsA